MPFYDLFISAVDRNDSISDIQKLNYLKASFQDEAAVILSHSPLTASNYRIGLKLLEDQHSNNWLILKSHMDAILEAPPLRIESSEGLRRLQLTLDENLMAMEAMSINNKVNCFFWVHIVSEKLDPESRRQWELDSAGDDIRKIDDLRKFIIKRARALEASEKKNYIRDEVKNNSRRRHTSNKRSRVITQHQFLVPFVQTNTESFNAIDSRKCHSQREVIYLITRNCASIALEMDT